jgi:hypothetical protein
MSTRSFPRQKLLHLAKHLSNEAQTRMDDEMEKFDQLLFSNGEADNEEVVEELHLQRQMTIVVSNVSAALLQFASQQRSPLIPSDKVQEVVDAAIDYSYEYISKHSGENALEDEDFIKGRDLIVARWKVLFEQKMLEVADDERSVG